ncbi:MAG TPA: right-handed parallel beta-helix repeat-containing protein [Vicinamibacteria bacterium]
MTSLVIGVLGEGGGRRAYGAGPWYVNVAGGDDANDCLAAAPGPPGVGPCLTVGAAIDKAASGDTVLIASGTYVTRNISLTKSISLAGAGQTLTVLSANDSGRHFINPAGSTLVLNKLSVRNANLGSGGGVAGAVLNAGSFVAWQVEFKDNQTDGEGGALFNMQGSAALLFQSSFFRNTAVNGGAIGNGGYLVVDQVSFLANEAVNGGAISNGGEQALVTLARSVLRDNQASSRGGAIFNNGGGLSVKTTSVVSNSATVAGGGIYAILFNPVTIEHSAVVRNTAFSNGAGIYITSTGSPVRITNSTVSLNSATGQGGGIYNEGSPLDIAFSTVATNSALSGTGGGLRLVAGTTRARGLLLADNAGTDCSGVLTSAAYNLIENTTGCTVAGDTTGNVTGADPNLAPLRQEGGFGETQYPFLPVTPVLDAVPVADCTDLAGNPLSHDQNLLGGVRPQGPGCDIGAVEVRSGGGIGFIATTTAVPGEMRLTWSQGTSDAYDLFYRASLLDPPASVVLGPVSATRTYLDSSPPPAGIYCHLLLAYDTAFAFAGASSFACSLATVKSGAFPADAFSLQPVGSNVLLRWERELLDVDAYILATVPLGGATSLEYLSGGVTQVLRGTPASSPATCFALASIRGAATSLSNVHCRWDGVPLAASARSRLDRQLAALGRKLREPRPDLEPPGVKGTDPGLPQDE